MKDIRAISLAVFAASFLIGFLIFEADKNPDMGDNHKLQLSMMPLFSSSHSME